MSKIYDLRKKSLTATAVRYAKESPVMKLICIEDWGDEWRCIVEFDTKTLVELPNGDIATAGPVDVGIRYPESFLSEAPHPFGIATVLAPSNIFHPNVGATGATCMGHPEAGLSLDTIFNQIWAGLNINLNVANTIPGQVANARAAEYVRTNAARFPLNDKGLFEEPVKFSSHAPK